MNNVFLFGKILKPSFKCQNNMDGNQNLEESVLLIYNTAVLSINVYIFKWMLIFDACHKYGLKCLYLKKTEL